MSLKKNFFEVILVNTQLPENLGAVARSMLNFNFEKLRVVNPKFSLDNQKIIPLAAGADKIIANIKRYDHFEDSIKDFHFLVATTNRIRSIKKKEINTSGLVKLIKTKKKIGLVFGPENNGLDNDHLALCDCFIRINSNPNFSSLNLSHAVIIICQKIYEKLYGDYKFVKKTKIKNGLAKKNEIISFYEILEEVLEKSNFFLVKERKKITLQKIKNIFGKINLTSKEVRTLVAMLRNLSK